MHTKGSAKKYGKEPVARSVLQAPVEDGVKRTINKHVEALFSNNY